MPDSISIGTKCHKCGEVFYFVNVEIRNNKGYDYQMCMDCNIGNGWREDVSTKK